MGKKSQRIAELERQLAGVTAERDALRSTAAAYQRRLRDVEAVRKPSLVEQARQRAAEYGDRILEGLGF